MSRWWRALRVADWGVQLLLLWGLALVYHAGSGLAALPFVRHLAAVSAGTAVLMAGAYLFNNWCDRDADRHKARHDALAQRRPGLVLALAGACLGGGPVLLWLLARSPAVAAVGAAQAAVAVLYSLPGPRLKERGRWGLVAATLAQRVPALVMLALGFPVRAATLAALLGWTTVVGLLFIVEHQLEDLRTDSRTGVRTWAAGAGRLRAQRARQRLYGVFGLVNLAAAAAVALAAPGAAGVAAAVFLLAGGATLRTLGQRRYVGNRSLPRRGELGAPGAGRRVLVRGDGLGGLVAAIRLADWGFAVEVRGTATPTAGTDHRGESVHAVRFDPAFLADYLDLPLVDCFARVRRETLYLEGRPRRTSSPHWVCRRGPGPGTLDARLTALARARGVVFTAAGGDSDSDSGPAAAAILATGLDPATTAAPGQRATRLTGWLASAPHEGPDVLLTYLGAYTHPNYGYVATCGGTAFALLFSRCGVAPEALARFERDLRDTEQLDFARWRPLDGAVPRECRLFAGDTVLAGTLAGMIDPFWYSGVSGALLSGGVAALALVDRDLAAREHRQFTRRFSAQLALADLAERLPWRLALATWAVNGVIEPAGSLGRWCRPPRDEGTRDHAQAPAGELEHQGQPTVG